MNIQEWINNLDKPTIIIGIIFIVIIVVLIVNYTLCKNTVNQFYAVEGMGNAKCGASGGQTIEKMDDIIIPSSTVAGLPTVSLYYAEWCGWSRKFLPVWKEFAEWITQNKKGVVNVNTVECDKTNDDNLKAMCNNVQGFPTVLLYKNGENIEYSGNRTLDDLKQFITKNI